MSTIGPCDDVIDAYEKAQAEIVQLKERIEKLEQFRRLVLADGTTQRATRLAAEALADCDK